MAPKRTKSTSLALLSRPNSVGLDAAVDPQAEGPVVVADAGGALPFDLHRVRRVGDGEEAGVGLRVVVEAAARHQAVDAALPPQHQRGDPARWILLESDQRAHAQVSLRLSRIEAVRVEVETDAVVAVVLGESSWT